MPCQHPRFLSWTRLRIANPKDVSYLFQKKHGQHGSIAHTRSKVAPKDILNIRWVNSEAREVANKSYSTIHVNGGIIHYNPHYDVVRTEYWPTSGLYSEARKGLHGLVKSFALDISKYLRGDDTVSIIIFDVLAVFENIEKIYLTHSVWNDAYTKFDTSGFVKYDIEHKTLSAAFSEQAWVGKVFDVRLCPEIIHVREAEFEKMLSNGRLVSLRLCNELLNTQSQGSGCYRMLSRNENQYLSLGVESRGRQVGTDESQRHEKSVMSSRRGSS
jgi:hypothetical protein